MASHQRRVLLFEIIPHALCGCDEGSLLIVESSGGERVCFSVFFSHLRRATFPF